MKIGAQQGREAGERLAVQIVDGGGEHEDGENPPSIAGRAGGWCHWNSMVATSPAVARRASALGKYSMVTRRGFWMPHPSCAWLEPEMTILVGSLTNSFTVLWSSPSTIRRACLPRQSTCLRLPTIFPDACGPSHHGTASVAGFESPLYFASSSWTCARAASFRFAISRASSSALRRRSASS